MHQKPSKKPLKWNNGPPTVCWDVAVNMEDQTIDFNSPGERKYFVAADGVL